MAKIKITLTKSPISRIPAQRKTVVALGLGKMGSSTVKEDTPAVRAMAASIGHLVTVTEAGDADKAPNVKKASTAKADKSAAKADTEPDKSDKPAKAAKPNAASKVAEIKAYLDEAGIEYEAAAKKADLLALIK